MEAEAVSKRQRSWGSTVHTAISPLAVPERRLWAWRPDVSPWNTASKQCQKRCIGDTEQMSRQKEQGFLGKERKMMSFPTCREDTTSHIDCYLTSSRSLCWTEPDKVIQEHTSPIAHTHSAPQKHELQPYSRNLDAKKQLRWKQT